MFGYFVADGRWLQPPGRRRTPRPPETMSWFSAIVLPQFPLQAILRLREELSVEPIVVVEGSTEKGWVLEMTSAAEASGVERGMASTQAMARCPGLRLWPRSTGQELAVNTLLLEAAG